MLKSQKFINTILINSKDLNLIFILFVVVFFHFKDFRQFRRLIERHQICRNTWKCLKAFEKHNLTSAYKFSFAIYIFMHARTICAFPAKLSVSETLPQEAIMREKPLIKTSRGRKENRPLSWVMDWNWTAWLLANYEKEGRCVCQQEYCQQADRQKAEGSTCKANKTPIVMSHPPILPYFNLPFCVCLVTPLPLLAVCILYFNSSIT